MAGTAEAPTRKLSTFRIDGQLFGVDVQDVQEVTRHQELTSVPLAPAGVSGLMNLRGQVVTVVDLRHRLGYGARSEDVVPANVVVRNDGSSGGAVSLLVDSVDGFEDVCDEQFAARPDTVRGPARDLVVGAYKLDHELLLALDVKRVIEVETSP